MYTGAHDKLVDKCLLTTMLMQLKAAVSLSTLVLNNYYTVNEQLLTRLMFSCY